MKKVPSKFSEIPECLICFLYYFLEWACYYWCYLVLHQNLAFSALLMSTSFPAHLFTILFKLLWGRGRFIIEASAILNLA